RMPGRFMTIPAMTRVRWNKAHENENKASFGLCGGGRPRPAPLGARGPQNRPRVRHTYLHLAQRQSGGRETVTAMKSSVSHASPSPRRGEVLITGDPEFKPLEEIKIGWLK